MQTDLTILVTGVGAPGTRGTLYSLRSNPAGIRPRIIGTDLRTEIAGRFLCDKFYLLPQPEDPDYLPRLIEIVRRESVALILPQTTREVGILARACEDLAAQGIRAAVSSAESVTAANNKYEVLKAFDRLCLPVPEYRLTRSERELCECVRALGYPRNPVIVKPPLSNGMRGFRILQENSWNAERFMAEKPSGVEITLEDLLAILHRSPLAQWPELLVTEYLPGPEYSVDAFIGVNSRIAIPRLRGEIRSGISFVTKCELRTDLMEFTLAAAEHLGLRLAFGFQYKLDSAGTPKVLECNPRVQGTMAASSCSGVNVIWLAVSETLGEPQAAGLQQVHATSRFYRYWGGIGVVDDQTSEI
jgi:carbamoyl-phosphate synthase large subunit